jgi:hypothetical protein
MGGGKVVKVTYNDESTLMTGRVESLEKREDSQKPISPPKIDIWPKHFHQDEFQFAYELV